MPKLKTTPATTNLEALRHEPIVHPRVNSEDVVILGVDPGEKHVGVSVGCRYFFDAAGYGEFCVLCASGEHEKQQHRPPDWKLQPPGWRVYDVAELTPWEFVLFFRKYINFFDIVTCEKFTLYPDKAKEQIGSEMPTSKLIGWLEFTIELWNKEQTKTTGAVGSGYPEIHYESNPAQIHAGTRSLMKKLNIPFVSPATPDHARSSELHLWHTLFRNSLVEGVTLR